VGTEQWSQRAGCHQRIFSATRITGQRDVFFIIVIIIIIASGNDYDADNDHDCDEEAQYRDDGGEAAVRVAADATTCRARTTVSTHTKPPDTRLAGASRFSLGEENVTTQILIYFISIHSSSQTNVATFSRIVRIFMLHVFCPCCLCFWVFSVILLEFSIY
jgi:hypothetical protein